MELYVNYAIEFVEMFKILRVEFYQFAIFSLQIKIIVTYNYCTILYRNK